MGLIKGLESIKTNNKNTIQFLLKTNKILKELKVGEVVFDRSEVKLDTIKDNLTIQFNPFFVGFNHTERSMFRKTYEEFKKSLISLAGSREQNYYYELNEEEGIKLKVVHNSKKYDIGVYLPKRNLIVIYLGFPRDSSIEELGKDHEYFFKILEYLKDLFKEHNIKEVDVTELKREMLLNNFSRVLTERKQALSRDTTAINIEIEDYSAKLVEWEKKVILNKSQIENIKILQKNINKGLLDSLEDIKKLSFVTNIELVSEGIKVTFKNIDIIVQGNSINMGVYEVLIKPSKIEITNLRPIVYKGTTYHSPHIEENRACFGDQKTTINTLLANFELKKLTHLLYLYLKSYNPEDTYLSMDRWIEARENGDIIEEEEEYEGEEE